MLRYKCKPLQPKCKSHSSTVKDFTRRRVNRLWFVWDPTLGFILWLCAAVACNRYLKRTALQNALIINNKSINCTASQQCWNSHSFTQLTGSKVWLNYIVSFANDSEQNGTHWLCVKEPKAAQRFGIARRGVQSDITRTITQKRMTKIKAAGSKFSYFISVIWAELTAFTMQLNDTVC